jgi:hypothetical protein
VKSLDLSSDADDLRRWDGIMLFWIAFWLVMGIALGVTIWGLTGLADSAVASGKALNRAGESFESLGDIPIVGSGPAQFGSEIRATAEGIVANGSTAGRNIRGLAVLLGVSIAVLPSFAILALYLPLRLARRRDVQEVQAALGTEGLSDDLIRYLALRARSVMSYQQVEAASAGSSSGPDADRSLARAELQRLGIATSATDSRM